ncbi:MAG: hypothetical protein Q9188_004530, partial [Gyalolechia gomerana]
IEDGGAWSYDTARKGGDDDDDEDDDDDGDDDGSSKTGAWGFETDPQALLRGSNLV